MRFRSRVPNVAVVVRPGPQAVASGVRRTPVSDHQPEAVPVCGGEGLAS